MAEFIEKPSVVDQHILLREYQKLLQGTPFEQLKLDEYQQHALKAYMETAGDKFGAQVASELHWPITFCCSMRKVKRTTRRVQKELKSVGCPAGKEKILKKYHSTLKLTPVAESHALSDAFKLKCRGASVSELKAAGVTDTQIRKMRAVTRGLASGASFAALAEIVLVSEVEIKLMAKIQRESREIKAV